MININKLIILITATILILSLISCSQKIIDPYQKYNNEYNNFWEIKGRITIDSDSKDISPIPLLILWKRNGDNNYIELKYPLADNYILITEESNKTTLVDARDKNNVKSYKGKNINNLVYKVLKIIIPFNELKKWIIKQPITTNDINYNEWNVDYEGYSYKHNNRDKLYPKRIHMIAEENTLDKINRRNKNITWFIIKLTITKIKFNEGNIL